ncbi:hypothetical protein CRUP_016394 [Coryphaenoides rupestris]|nr:hypothetical protein CRUP_016394 [Coryphaenoides rupestris]
MSSPTPQEPDDGKTIPDVEHFWTGRRNTRGARPGPGALGTGREDAMSSAEEKLYNGYLRTNMAAIATQVKAREIVPHLPCLTLSDREEIEAKRENNGNFNAMQLLLDCLCRWERWPEQFIAALEACEHVAMSATVRDEYDRLRRLCAPAASCPPSTVVKATVHSPPPVSPSAPPPPGAPQSSGAETSVPDAQNPPTPPPSPEVTHPSPPAEAPRPLQEPEENSEESGEFVAVGGAAGACCDVTAEAGSQPDSMESRQSYKASGPPSASECGAGGDWSEDLGSGSVTLTPEKVPVQDSEPPNLSKRMLVQNSVQPPAAESDVPDNPAPGPARRCDSVQPDTTQHATLLPTATTAGPAEPSFSGNNISLQISDPEQEGSGTHPQGSESSPGAPPQGNYRVSDDLASFAEQEEVLEHIGHVVEEPSIQNLASPAQGILGNEVQAYQDGQWDEKNRCQPEIVVQVRPLRLPWPTWRRARRPPALR